VNDTPNPNELRMPGSSKILSYFQRFSSTEKAVFGVLAIALIVTAAIMAEKVNQHFMTNVPGYGGTLREGEVGLPHAVNPVLAVTDVDRDIANLVYAGLMKYDGDSIVPDLAKSYTISPDGLTYTFNLRTNLKFQDGKPLTADDVAFTIQKIQDPAVKSPRNGDWTGVTVTVVSPTQIKFNLKQPYSPFLSDATIGIIPKHIWMNVSNDQFIYSDYNLKPVGAGPYEVDSISKDNGGIPTSYKLSTWRDYFGTLPHLGALVFNFYADEEKALSALDSGAIDSLASIAPGDAARLATDTAEPYRILSSPLPRIFGVFFNQSQNPALADKAVRQALDMSVNRDAIVKSALSGYGIAIHSPIPNGMVDASSSTTTSDKADVASAQALLEKNGWKKNANGIYEKKGKKDSTPLSFDLYTANTSDLKLAAEQVRKDWQALGADVTVKVFDASDLYQNVIRTRKYDALLFGEFIGKDRDLYAFWHSSQRNAPRLNIAEYANPKADKILEDLRSSTDDAANQAKYDSLASIIRGDVPAVFLFSPDFVYAVPKTLGGIDLGDITVPSDRWNSIESWYVETEHVWNFFNH